MYANRRNSRVVKEIGVEEHDGDVRFLTGSGNIAFSFMRHASGHNYRNSSFIVDVAIGQIPRFTERISSLKDGGQGVEYILLASGLVTTIVYEGEPNLRTKLR